MTIDIYNFDGTKLTTVTDGTIDTTSSTLKLVGKGYKNWGEPQQENILWVMQNFSGTIAPLSPVKGQLWYDTNDNVNIIKVWNGTDWVSSGSVVTQISQPPAGSNPGALWFDTTNMQLNSWNGTSWNIVGPLGSSANTDPINPPVPVNSVVEAIRIRDNNPSPVLHQAWRITVGGTVIAILSKDQAYTPVDPIFINNGFSTILPGINFNSTIANVGISGDNTLFKTTQNNVPDSDRTRNLGSPAARFSNIYTYGQTVSGNLRVTGTSYFGPSLSDIPPAQWAPSSLIPSPKVGSIEFDGNTFYFTNRVNGLPARQVPVFSQELINTKRLYVSNLGDDTNSGREPTRALKTIKAALAVAEAGYTIFVESGDYYEQNPLLVPARVSIVGDNLRRTTVWPVHNNLDLFHVNVGSYFFGMTFKGHRAPAFCFAFPCSLANAVVSGGQVTSIEPLYSQTGYTSAPQVYIEPPPFGGTQATATAVLVDGAITDITLSSGGANYSSNVSAITATVTSNTGAGAVLKVRVQNGVIKAVDIINPGAGYSTPVTLTITDEPLGTGAGAEGTVSIGNGVIGYYNMTNLGSGYSQPPYVSVKAVVPPIITSSPYVQNCSSITGPFDIYGKQIILNPPYDINNPGFGYGPVDPNGAGAGIRIDGEVCDPNTVIRSFVADSFTQINQGGIGHLIINRGYAQFVSCFTTFSSVGYWARSGGFANITNSVIDFGDIGLRAEGFYKDAAGNGYETGTLSTTYTSTVGSITITGSGSGYPVSSSFNVTVQGGSATLPASGVAFTDVNGTVIRVDVTNPGIGYTAQPTGVDFSAGAPGTGAAGFVNLIQNSNVLVTSSSVIPVIPKNSTGMLIAGNFYTVISASQYSPAQWNVNIYPPLLAGVAGSLATFHDISNLSTGGLALEYVGSGVTYNALPYYGGIPDVSKQVEDEVSNPELKPGRVFYVTIDNTGNFKIGEFFAVNFADGSVTLNANSFNLSGLSAIGPFKRNGFAVGVQANEISDDAELTHPANPQYDRSTIPTQFAVRQYLQQMSTNLLPDNTLTRNLGSSLYKWNQLYSNTVISASGTFDSFNTANITATTGNIVTVTGTTGNFTNLNTDIVDTVNLVSDFGNIQGNFVVNGNFTVSGNSFIVNTQTYTVVDPVIEIGTSGNILLSDDGLDRGVISHYFRNTGTSRERAGYNHSFFGRSNTPGSNYGNFVYITNVAPGTTTVPSITPIPGTPGSTTSWGNISAGFGTFNGNVTVTSFVNSGTVNATSVSTTTITASGACSFGATTVTGELNVTGDIVAFSTSDARLKKNLSKIRNALDKVDSITGYTFNWNDEAVLRGKTAGVREAGLLAQEVETVLPEVVSNRADAYKAVNYEKLVPLLIEAIKELRSEVEDLKRNKN